MTTIISFNIPTIASQKKFIIKLTNGHIIQIKYENTITGIAVMKMGTTALAT